MTKDLACPVLTTVELTQLLELLSEASQAILTHYRSDAAAEYQDKHDSTPLTQADLNAHSIICQGLRVIFPDVPILSEESDSEVKKARRAWSEYWLVDPLDGTREFLNRTGEFTINVALIRDHSPIIGFIAAPCLNAVWFGGAQCEAYKLTLDGKFDTPQRIRCRSLASVKGVTVLSAVRHRNKKLQATLDYLSALTPSVERRDSGSALKFCQLAEGKGDIYPRFSPCCEWDTGAGQALVEGAGGAVLSLSGGSLRYNDHASLMSPHFIAVADPAAALWAPLRQQLQDINLG